MGGNFKTDIGMDRIQLDQETANWQAFVKIKGKVVPVV
jgi:hypothetical protein